MGKQGGYVEGMEGVGLAWNLKAARFHRKPSCEILPSGWTQARRGASRWMAPGMAHGRPRAQKRRDRWRGGCWVVAGLCVRARVVAALSS